MDTQVKKESDQGNVRCGSSPWQTLSWPHHQTGLRYSSRQSRLPAARCARASKTCVPVTEEPMPLIVLNVKDAPNGQVFALLHEFCHLLFRKGGIRDLKDRRQKPEETPSRSSATGLPRRLWFLYVLSPVHPPSETIPHGRRGKLLKSPRCPRSFRFRTRSCCGACSQWGDSPARPTVPGAKRSGRSMRPPREVRPVSRLRLRPRGSVGPDLGEAGCQVITILGQGVGCLLRGSGAIESQTSREAPFSYQ